MSTKTNATVTFEMQDKNYSDYIRVKVFATRKSMLNFCEKQGWGKETSAVRAMVHPEDHHCNSKTGMLYIPNMYVTVIFNREDLDMATLAHECVHVTFAHERYINHFIGAYTDENDSDEERFAYFYDSLLDGMLRLLKSKGITVRS